MRRERHEAGVSWRIVLFQALVFSAVAWVLAVALAFGLSVIRDRGFTDAFEVASIVVAALALLFGVIGTAGGPIPMSPQATRGLIRPIGPLSRRVDSLLRHPRTSSQQVHMDAQVGLAPMGIALVVAAPLLVASAVVG